MNEYRIVINKEGYVTEGLVLLKDEIVQEYVLKDGEFLVPIINKTQNINIFKDVPLVKPRWTGSEWIETATEEELNEAYPIIKVEPSQDEILRANILKDNANIQLQLAQQQKINAKLLSQIAKLGGTN